MTLHTNLESHPHIGPPATDTTAHDVAHSRGGRAGVWEQPEQFQSLMATVVAQTAQTP